MNTERKIVRGKELHRAQVDGKSDITISKLGVTILTQNSYEKRYHLCYEGVATVMKYEWIISMITCHCIIYREKIKGHSRVADTDSKES